MDKVIYLAGGCYWGCQKYMDNIYGVKETLVGFANGNFASPTYDQVKHENTGHAETVKVIYDPDMITLSELLQLFYRIIDPVSVDKQGEDEGHQYRTGVYYVAPSDEVVITETLRQLEKQIGAPIAVECLPLDGFWPAHEAHQKYLDKNPQGYCHVPFQAIEQIKAWRPEREGK